MSTQVTQLVIEGFLADKAGHWLAHDVELVDMASGRIEKGRLTAHQCLREMLVGTGAPVIVVSGAHAAVEWSEANIVLTVEVDDGEIARMRCYLTQARVEQ